MIKRLRFLLCFVATVFLQNEKLWADHYMGGQISYETIDLDSQRGVFNIVLKLERPCNVLNKFYNEYTFKVLEYATSPSAGYYLSVYVAKLFDSSYIYYPCSTSANTCTGSSGQVIEVKYFRATIVVQNTNKKCLVYFDENAERTYSDNIQNPYVPLILYTEFIPKYQNTQYKFEESKRQFPLKGKAAIINYTSSDVENDSLAIQYGLPFTNLSYTIIGSNLNYTLTKATPKISLSDAKPLWMSESSLTLNNNQTQFTPTVVQSSWVTLLKNEFRKVNLGTKDTWILISKSNCDRLMTVYDIPTQFYLQSVQSLQPNVKITSNQITICNENTPVEINFRFPIESSIQLSKLKIELGLQDLFPLSTLNRKSGSTMDTLVISILYNHSNSLDFISVLRFDMDLCHSTTGIGFSKSFDVGFTVFNHKLFNRDTILSCTNNFSIPLLLGKSITTNWGTYQSTNNSIFFANPKDTWVIAILNFPNPNCPSQDSIYLNHGSVFSTTTYGYPSSCKGYQDAAAKVVATGTNMPFTYRWSNNSTLDSIGSIGAGLHIVEVRDKDNCLQLDSVVIPETQGIDAIWIVDTPITCYKGNNGRGHIQINSSLKPTHYFWDSLASIDSFLNNLSSGVYTGKYHYKNLSNTNCIQNYSFTIDDPDSMYLDIAVSHNTCFGEEKGKIAVIPRGGSPSFEYYFDNVYSPSGYKSNLPNDTIDIYVVDAQACTTSIRSAIIQSPEKLKYNMIASNPSCKGVSNGSLLLNHPQGGKMPYTYSLNNSTFESNNNFTYLSEGSYKIILRDANNCIFEQSYTLLPDYLLQVNLTNLEHSICPLSNSGKIHLNITNGSIPYKVFSSNDSTLYYIRNVELSPLKRGNHIVKIKDNNGCIWNNNYTINEPDTIQLDYLLKNESCYQFKDGSVQILQTKGGNPPYTSQRWYNSSNDLIGASTNLTPGIYKLRFEDSKNCPYEKTFSIEAKPEFKVKLQQIETIKCFGGQNGKVTTNIIGGSQPLVYRWLSHPNLSGGKLENISSGKYIVEIEDKDGCKTTDSTILIEPKPISLVYLKTKSTDCPNINNGIVDLSCLSSSDTSTAMWYKIQGLTDYRTDNKFSGLRSGIYTVIAKDIQQCEANYTAQIGVDKSLEVTLPSHIYFELGETKTLDPTISYGVNTSVNDINSIKWMPQIGLSCVDCIQTQFTANKSDYYSVEIDYGKSCKAKSTGYFEVSKPEDLFIPNSFSPNADNKNDIWYVYGKNVKNIDIKLLNRVGELIFSSTDIYKGWDGTYLGKKELTGVYHYLIRATYADGSEKKYEGFLNLFR